MTEEEAFLILIKYFTTQQNWEMVKSLLFELGVKENFVL